MNGETLFFPFYIVLLSSFHFFLYYQDMHEELSFRKAEVEDVPLIFTFIKELALYESLLNEVKADEETLRYNLFDRRIAEVLFPMIDGKEIGFVLFFHNFSTFLGKPGVYIEDLYIRKEFRGRGYGKATIEKIREIAKERGCGRVEWWCLDSNTPSIRFYKESIGAEAMTDWTVYRLTL